jgi:LPPG:FO 2-phospho-L-lactate transferase
VITVLAGGVGAARFLRGLVLAVDPSLVTAVVNTGDDTELHGLSISPDIDTVTYTVAGAIDPDRGWGLAEESWIAMENLARYAAVRPVGSGAAPDWFNLGDRDLATHFYRTARLTEGATLSEVTDEIARAWGLDVRVVPMTDDRVRTMVDIVDNGVVTTVGFQEYFVKRRHAVPVTGIRFDGAEHARPTFVDTINSSEVVIIAPSNPLVSIGPIRALDGVDRALTANRERVAAISPIVAGSALKGPADRMLTELGFEASVVGVARLYAPVCATLVIDERDADRRTEVEDCGVRCVVTDTIMRTPEVTRALADITLTAAREGAPHGR